MSHIHDLPQDQRPREKLAQNGASTLSDSELLAIFLRVGVKGQSAIEIGTRLLHTHGSLSHLSRLSHSELATEFGIGPAKAAQLCASFEIATRIARETVVAQPIHNPEFIYDVMVPLLRAQSTESLHIMLSDARIRHTRTIHLSTGSVDQTTCHPREVLSPVIRHQAYGFVLIHNHPSGDPSPSDADDRITKKLIEASQLMQVRFLDHVIIGQSIDGCLPYYSYRLQSAFFSKNKDL